MLDVQQIFRFLDRYPETSTIIINGGDPLVIKPEYYWEILEYIRKKRLLTNISFTTNLWDFCQSPNKWRDLFNQPEVGVTTSFQFGPGRTKANGEVYSESDFWKASDLMLKYCGYRPDFISVINSENEHFAIDNVALAKKMSEGKKPGTGPSGEKIGVECKLNYMMASGTPVYHRGAKKYIGAGEQVYELSRIYQIYLQVYRENLTDWEFNTKQLRVRLKGGATSCPQNRNCDEGIRALNPDGSYYSCGAFGDDKDKGIDFELEVSEGKFFTPLSSDPELFSLKQECLTCPMFQICNGCRKTIKDMKKFGVVESHCSKMKSIANEILAI